MSVLLAGVAAVLFGVGTYLVLQRQLSRIVIGVGLMGHGTNVLFVLSTHGRGRPAFVGDRDGSAFTDPLPQALALTGIVITFAVTAFLLALAYRSWIVTHDDEVEDAFADRYLTHEEERAIGGPLSDSDRMGGVLADPDVERSGRGRGGGRTGRPGHSRGRRGRTSTGSGATSTVPGATSAGSGATSTAPGATSTGTTPSAPGAAPDGDGGDGGDAGGGSEGSTGR